MTPPIYRAKKINSDKYIEGLLLPEMKRYDLKSFIITRYHRMQDMDNAVEIDPSTLAIHMEGMLDSDGAKIFASLSEDGKGGDILEYIEEKDFSNNTKKGSVTLSMTGLHGTSYSFLLTDKDRHYKKENSIVIGIQQ